MSEFKALVTGATGIQGGPLLKLLQEDKRFAKIWAVSRRELEVKGDKIINVRLDLTDEKAVAKSLKDNQVEGVTHVFHTAFSGDMTNMSLSVANMLRNIVEALEETKAPLQHVYTTLGGKYYGMHFGAAKSPFDERDPRHIGDNYYYALEDYLIERREKGAKWTWSSLRPGVIVGYSISSTMNLLMDIGIYGTLCKELGLEFRYPGTETSYNQLIDSVDHNLLMDAAIWTSTTPEARNNSYNVSNGDIFRWRDMWPQIADWFGLKAGLPLKVPLDTLMTTESMKKAWADAQKKHKLRDVSMDDVASWPFANATFGVEFDNINNVTKLRQAGYTGMVLDSATAWLQQLDKLADEHNIIPRYTPKRERRPLPEAQRQE
jgi:nucleoside-diphosphate-sugar epimerase